jgi:hypothetical protein
MARLIVFAKPDNDHPDPELNAAKFKRGDVVDVLPDGVDPGRDIMGQGDQNLAGWWRVIDVPGLTAEEAQTFLSHQNDADGIVPRKRLNGLDLDALETAAAQALGRALGRTERLSRTRLQVIAARVRRSSIARKDRF